MANKPNQYLIFNGDADGICAAHQYYLNYPIEFNPITGVKRDIGLLKQVADIDNADLTVFDIAVEKNLPELHKLLTAGCTVKWFDHHVSENIPRHKNLSVTIDTDPLVNTSHLVAKALAKPSLWSVVGLFGDNISKTAGEVAAIFALKANELASLQELGELMNYNGYGATLADLHLHPAEILKSMRSYDNPLEYIADSTIVADLRRGMEKDLNQTSQVEEPAKGIYLFPDEKWARRVIGIFANQKATAEPDKAHAVLTEKRQESGYVVSVRSPLNSEKSAAAFCKQFPTGGGRLKAAGINLLPKDQLGDFVDRFALFFN